MLAKKTLYFGKNRSKITACWQKTFTNHFILAEIAQNLSILAKIAQNICILAKIAQKLLYFRRNNSISLYSGKHRAIAHAVRKKQSAQPMGQTSAAGPGAPARGTHARLSSLKLRETKIKILIFKFAPTCALNFAKIRFTFR